MTSVTFHLTLPLVKICGSVGQLSATGYSQGTLKADSVFSWALKNNARVSPYVLISISSVVKIWQWLKKEVKTDWKVDYIKWSSSSLCAICSQQVGCHGSPSFSILCHSDTVIIWHFCPFLDVIRPHCSRSPSSSSTIYPSFHQQSLYPISSYYMSKILTFPFFDSI